MKKTVDEVIITLKPLASKNGLVLECYDIDDIVIPADKGKIKQILFNLIGNAIKFTPGAGTVTISTYKMDRILNIQVKDTGIGISEDDQQKLFDPFKQIDSSLSRKYEGTGLGLSLVKKLTELHNGTVSVESELGKGSTFTVSLPVDIPEYLSLQQ